MQPSPWLQTKSNSDFLLNERFKDKLLECEGYDDDFEDFGNCVALVVDECNVGKTKHVQLHVLGASDTEHWSWIMSEEHPNPGWYYFTAKPLEESKAARVKTTKSEPSLALACFRELDAIDGPTLGVSWILKKSLTYRAVHRILPPDVPGQEETPGASSKAGPPLPPKHGKETCDAEKAPNKKRKDKDRASVQVCEDSSGEHQDKAGLRAQLQDVRDDVMGAQQSRRAKVCTGPFAATEGTKLMRNGGESQKNSEEAAADRERASSDELHDSPQKRGRSPRSRSRVRRRRRRRRRSSSEESDASQVFRDASHSTKPSNCRLVQYAAKRPGKLAKHLLAKMRAKVVVDGGGANKFEATRLRKSIFAESIVPTVPRSAE